MSQTATAFHGTEPASDEVPMLSAAGAPRVLVVDDEPLMRWALAEALAGQGCEVLEAEDAGNALKLVQERRNTADVVLLDLRLPDSSDLELLCAIRRLAPTCRIILMSADVTPEIETEAYEQGAFRVLEKPFDITTVILPLIPLPSHG